MQGNLLETLRSRGDAAGEEQLMRTVVAGLEAAAGPDNPDTSAGGASPCSSPALGPARP